MIKSNQGAADHTIKSLFSDLSGIIQFLVQNLPTNFIGSVSDTMMPILSARIKEYWLDNAVPTSLEDLHDYQVALLQVKDFSKALKEKGWPDTASFDEWVSGVPKIWLAKRRETSLDWIRHQISLGKPFQLSFFHGFIFHRFLHRAFWQSADAFELS
jgi:centromere/kinetochore protein ZW10